MHQRNRPTLLQHRAAILGNLKGCVPASAVVVSMDNWFDRWGDVAALRLCALKTD